MIKRILFIISVFLFFINAQSVFAGNVTGDYKYAWSNNGGYTNFEQMQVDDSSITGFAWSANFGWIKFNPSYGGVLNDGNGNLSGSAWGDNTGWIDFDNVSINPSTGKFSGTATGLIIGTITFDCSYCDVRTDWRSSGRRTPSGGGGTVRVSSTSTLAVIPTDPGARSTQSLASSIISLTKNVLGLASVSSSGYATTSPVQTTSLTRYVDNVLGDVEEANNAGRLGVNFLPVLLSFLLWLITFFLL